MINTVHWVYVRYLMVVTFVWDLILNPAIKLSSNKPVLNKRHLYILLFLLCFSQMLYAKNAAIDSAYGIATEYFKQGDYSAYLQALTNVLKMAEQTDDCSQIGYASMKIGGAYYFLQQRDICQKWMFKARKLAYDCGIDSLKRITNRQIGAVYYEVGKIDSSLIYLLEAEQLLRNTNDWNEYTTLYAILGEVYYRSKNDKQKGWECFNLSEKYALLSGDTNKLGFIYTKKGIIGTLEGKCTEGINNCEKALKLYTAGHLPEGVMYALYNLGHAYSECGDAKASYNAMLMLKALCDSIFKAETAEKTARYRTLYETEKKEKENLVLAKDNALQKLQIIEDIKNRRIITVVFISGIVVLLAVFLLLYTRYKQKKKEELDQKIAEQQRLRFKAVLEAEEKERVRIARELHDSLGQMLSAAKMNMSAMDTYNEEDSKLINNAQKLVDDAVKEVRTISHNLMPASLMDKGIITALNELANKINDTGLLHIELMINSSEERLDSSLEIAIYRIVQEVINNMIKHSKANKVEVLLDYNSDKIYMSIKDNGVGFDTEKIEQSSGIGWKNIFSRVYMMNGDVQVNSQPGRGTLVNIEFSK